VNYLSGLASNCDPPDLCLLSSYDYRCEPLVPAQLFLVPEVGARKEKDGGRSLQSASQLHADLSCVAPTVSKMETT
jgi:hypothetical protein